MSPAAVQIVRLSERLPDGFDAIERDAAAEDYRFVEALAQEWHAGRYDGTDERYVLLAALRDGVLVAVGGLTPDPYDDASDLLRVRHVYVRPAARRAGVGRVLAGALIQQGLALVPRLSLRAADAGAAAFWEALGFRADESGGRRSHLLQR